MAEHNDHIQDDEFRVLRPSSSSTPLQDGKPSRFNLYVSIISAIIVLAIGIIAIVKWPKEKPRDSDNTLSPQSEVFIFKYGNH